MSPPTMVKYREGFQMKWYEKIISIYNKIRIFKMKLNRNESFKKQAFLRDFQYYKENLTIPFSR
jgi:hypothetical protein